MNEIQRISQEIISACEGVRSGELNQIEYGVRMSSFMDPEVIESLARAVVPPVGEYPRKVYDLAQSIIREEKDANERGRTTFNSEASIEISKALIRMMTDYYWALRAVAKIKKIATVPTDNDEVIEFAANMHRHLAAIRDIAQSVQDEAAK